MPITLKCESWLIYLLSLTQDGDSLNTGIRLITHLKIHISVNITARVTTISIQDGTYLIASSHLNPMTVTLSRFMITPSIVSDGCNLYQLNIIPPVTIEEQHHWQDYKSNHFKEIPVSHWCI